MAAWVGGCKPWDGFVADSVLANEAAEQGRATGSGGGGAKGGGQGEREPMPHVPDTVRSIIVMVQFSDADMAFAEF